MIRDLNQDGVVNMDDSTALLAGDRPIGKDVPGDRIGASLRSR